MVNIFDLVLSKVELTEFIASSQVLECGNTIHTSLNTWAIRVLHGSNKEGEGEGQQIVNTELSEQNTYIYVHMYMLTQTQKHTHIYIHTYLHYLKLRTSMFGILARIEI